MLKIFLVVFFVAAVGIDDSNSMQTPFGSKARKTQSQRYTATGTVRISSKATLQPSYFHHRSKSSPANLEDAANYVVRPNAPSIASTSRAPPTQPACPDLFNAVRQFFKTIQSITDWHIDLHGKFLDCLRQGGIVSENESFINYCAPKIYDESEIHDELKAQKASIDPGVKEDICNAVKTYCSQTYDYRDKRPLGGAVQTLLYGCPEVRQRTFTIPRLASNVDDSNAPSPEPMLVGPNKVEVRNREGYMNFQEFVKNYERNHPTTTQSRGRSGCAPRGCSIQ